MAMFMAGCRLTSVSWIMLYFAVSGEDGSCRTGKPAARPLQRRDMTRRTETLEQQETVAPHSNTKADVTFKGTN